MRHLLLQDLSLIPFIATILIVLLLLIKKKKDIVHLYQKIIK